MIKRLPHRYIITIAGDECEELEDSNSSQDLRSITSQEPYPGSIPDGWIYDENQGYCYLVECKVGTNPLNERQIRSHAREWLAIDDLRDLRDRILPLTWTDVAGAIEQVIKEADSGALPVGEQEWQVMTDLEEYLGFFGYRVFRGLDFTLLMRPPDFARLLRHVRQARIRLDFSGLIQPPEFRLNRT
jgi:hypothetical protein